MTFTPPELRTWIDGTPEASDLELDDALHDPNTGTVLQGNRASSPAQVERALAGAWSAHSAGTWRDLGLAGRAALLHRFADLVDEQQTTIAELDSLNSGVTLRETTLFASSLAGTVRGAIALAERRGESAELAADQGPVRLRRVPWGPTALIAPWNAPAAVAVKKMAYALLAGAPVVLKPSPASPWSAQLLAAAAAEAGLPSGVFALVLGGGEVGQQICADPRVKAISMTGSTATGRLIAQASAPNLTRLRLELGSNNPAIVLADADLAATVEDLAAGMTKLNGQWCEAPRRVLADRAVYADLVAGLAERLRRTRVGSALDADTEVGPMAFRQRRDDLEAQRAHLVAAGASAAHRTDVPGGGWFLAPTVVSSSGPVDLPGEVFGPMIAVEPFTTVEDALVRSNAGPHGLAGYVFAGDVERAIAVGGHLEAGEVKVNGTSLLDMCADSAQSFFGDSGLGGHGDADVLEFYAGKQIVGVDLVDAPM
ncbi:aldehyde dehydrogenase family protein [Nocardioides nitrophenolicus]|uniref:aldehyde dehydrogenase family protein n=1 Tax=Nocardioides nitrophenolicus TaxID=60489 RepID=UPI00195DAD92|nr:aldehyde dehydrogenase family protein [Nocardioides nitrophenolicus]MBM7515057.1 acyl-CoA reductase-like NAD-dependent aldehyde dehydrogenase [Nocardioides nitrophenolicus]